MIFDFSFQSKDTNKQTNSCQYTFNWETQYACSLLGNCTAGALSLMEYHTSNCTQTVVEGTSCSVTCGKGYVEVLGPTPLRTCVSDELFSGSNPTCVSCAYLNRESTSETNSCGACIRGYSSNSAEPNVPCEKSTPIGAIVGGTVVGVVVLVAVAGGLFFFLKKRGSMGSEGQKETNPLLGNRN